jgi:hypothetical protein
MLGFLTLGLTCVMIYTLVKNALVGTQLSSADTYAGHMDLIIPISSKAEFFLGPWLENLPQISPLNGQVRIHILVDGHHSSVNTWQEIREKLPFLEIHSFTLIPAGREAVPWMIEQIAPQITADVVIIADPELVPNQHAFLSLGKLVAQKQKAYFVLPQTHRQNLLGEAIATVNPTLALASIYGFRKFRRNISHPIMSMAQGWMGMPLVMFREFNWARVNISSWKEALAKGWDLENKSYILAFGERHLLRHYPDSVVVQMTQLRSYWQELWMKGEKTALWLFLAVLFIWSFPVLCFFSHPFWSLGSILLLILFRFFTKIVFQESWGAMILHPLGAMVWILTFFWWGFDAFKARYSKT